ncbi:sugar kinase [Salinibacter sp. 10B]|uniref:ROK family protein n=1 Tax=Salinibacter sp. 10B TaxID=1923971 RepID=UPI000CF49D94|nr:ROK family protein [Salinibacter sp. 10B]PQJ35591.1 sugar kinase [Salinibacter sp. 10B]
MSSYAVGIDLGGTNLKAALVHRENGIEEITQRPTEADQGPQHVVDRIAALADELRTQAPAEIRGIGIGSPGAINWERTTVTRPPNLPGWDSVNLTSLLREQLGDVAVILENDANVAGLGSAFHGAGRSVDSFIMVTLGTGVGGAIIYNNKIFRGSTGGAAEIGHMTIDYEGPYANTGVAGAIEGYIGQKFLSDHARDRLVNYPDSLLHDLVDGDLEQLNPRILYEAASEGDEAAERILAWAGHKLGCVLGAAINLLDIRTVVVGGGVSAAGDFILEPARETLPNFVMPGLRDDVTIRQEVLGNEVSLLGAARLAFEGREAHV